MIASKQYNYYLIILSGKVSFIVENIHCISVLKKLKFSLHFNSNFNVIITLCGKSTKQKVFMIASKQDMSRVKTGGQDSYIARNH